ncbi:PREDICTED: SWI/SNF-related matrix-associated actin-dependent regulator of chromatin subfamily A-like protein 1 [Priapulus caudatus]|uniref:SWI/SNF-related matrix-associated actin-dependent regulator of chromatin subfamily A-like protein 1 n=1 Tax=Priapulus caudatus TaxID=37621 RepID=A0ABM1EW89_PRICU|nr:PREDICTED: SWI/SNF-related matrix-associated actin-dependent regulator of chromatin subfamily A-like protein 1 [Priapulus caudatus]
MPYHAGAVAAFKTVPSQSYDATTKRWSFHVDDHARFGASLRPLRPGARVDPLPRFVLDAVSRRQGAPRRDDDPDLAAAGVDAGLVAALLPFQRVGVARGIAARGRLLLADDMGLGKTIQALAIAAYYRREWPLLVVCPSSVKRAWADAVARWLPSVAAGDVVVVDAARGAVAADAEVVVMSYDVMTRRERALASCPFRVVIFDESHFLKDAKSARTRVALRAVAPATFRSFREFGARYCAARQTRWGWDYGGASNLAELRAVADAAGVILRRTKREVLSQLPAKRRCAVLLGGVDAASARDAATRDLSGERCSGALLELFAATARAKAAAARDYVLDLLEGESAKMIVFAHHRCVMDTVAAGLSARGHRHVRVDGATSSDLRASRCDEFQTRDDCKVALLSIRAAGAGLTLTAASLVIFAELFWNPGVLMQAEDRAHRIGQRDSVDVRYLVAKGTADDQLWPLILRKLQVLNQAGLSKDDFADAATTVAPPARDEGQATMWRYLQRAMEEDEEGEAEMLRAAEENFV